MPAVDPAEAMDDPPEIELIPDPDINNEELLVVVQQRGGSGDWETLLSTTVSLSAQRAMGSIPIPLISSTYTNEVRLLLTALSDVEIGFTCLSILGTVGAVPSFMVVKPEFDANEIRLEPEVQHFQSSGSTVVKRTRVTAVDEDVKSGRFSLNVVQQLMAASQRFARQFLGFAAVTKYDNDVEGLFIEEADGPNLQVIESSVPFASFGTYTVRLTMKPESNVVLQVTPQVTPYAEDVDTKVQKTQTPLSLTFFNSAARFMTFTPDQWHTPQTVYFYAPLNKNIESRERRKLRAFSDRAAGASKLAGPVLLRGFNDPELNTEIPKPTMLPHEVQSVAYEDGSGFLFANLEAIEEKQVDTVILDDSASFRGQLEQNVYVEAQRISLLLTEKDREAAETANATTFCTIDFSVPQTPDPGYIERPIITGLRMGGNRTIAGRFLPGGVRYDEFEAIQLKLGFGGYAIDSEFGDGVGGGGGTTVEKAASRHTHPPSPPPLPSTPPSCEDPCWRHTV